MSSRNRSMVAFLAGLGGGMLKAQENERDRKRQEKIDAREDARFERERRGWEAQDALNTDLKDAAADREAVPGTVTGAEGNRVLTTDPAQTAAVQKTMADEAELRGEAAPTSRAGTGVMGKMARGNQIAEGEVDITRMNAPKARNQRVVDTLQKHGQIERAASMQNTMLDQQAKALGLESAQAQFADEQFNRRLSERLASPNWQDEAAGLLSETQVGALAGASVVARPTKDGKRMEFVASKEGQERVLGTFDKGDAGRAQFLQQVARVPLATKIGWIVEGERAAREEQRWQQTFDFNKKKEENDQQYRQRVLGLQMAQEARARQTHALAMEDAKIPPAVKLQAQTLAKQMETINGAMSKAMAEGMFDPNNPSSADLIKQQRVLGLQYQRLLAPYTPGSESKADPLGLNSPGAATGAAAAPGAGQPAASAAAAPAATSAPAAAPTAGGTPQLGPGGGYVPPQAAAGPMQAATARPQPSVAEVIAGPGAANSPALLASAQQKAAVIESLSAQMQEAQAGVVLAARSGGDVRGAMQQVAQVQAAVTEALAGMNEQQAAKVRAAAGL